MLRESMSIIFSVGTNGTLAAMIRAVIRSQAYGGNFAPVQQDRLRWYRMLSVAILWKDGIILREVGSKLISLRQRQRAS